MICGDGHNVHDQWQVQIQAQIQMKASVLIKTGYLGDVEIKQAHLEPVDDVERATHERLDAAGPHSRLCVIPEGLRRFRISRSCCKGPAKPHLSKEARTESARASCSLSG